VPEHGWRPWQTATVRSDFRTCVLLKARSGSDRFQGAATFDPKAGCLRAAGIPGIQFPETANHPVQVKLAYAVDQAADRLHI
jgi:hypothetical protein